MPTVEDIITECNQYFDTVIVFSFLQKKFFDQNINHFIERTVKISSGTKQVIPDFIIFKNNTLSDIIEHKASISKDKELAIKDINYCYKKYHKIQYNNKEFEPNVVLLYPDKSQYMINQIQEDIPDKLGLCQFNLKDISINFSRDCTFSNQILNRIFDLGPYICSIKEFSKQKFIKSEPPIVYTAFQITQILPSFCDVRTAFEVSFIVKREDLLRSMKYYYPPWISENLNQINSNRINNALIFLDDIKHIDWNKGNDEITVYRKKGSRSGDILRYFADKWCKIQEKGKHSRKKKKYLAVGQKTLFDY